MHVHNMKVIGNKTPLLKFVHEFMVCNFLLPQSEILYSLSADIVI